MTEEEAHRITAEEALKGIAYWNAWCEHRCRWCSSQPVVEVTTATRQVKVCMKHLHAPKIPAWAVDMSGVYLKRWITTKVIA